MTDAEGHAAIGTMSNPDWASPAEDPVARLRALLDDSQAMAWVKDPAGRHLYVNRRCLEALGTSEERLLGRTDAELPPHETVDGPRLSLAQDGIAEPEELEYTVPAVGSRDRLAAVRFAIRDAQGNAMAICGLAGPLENAWMVREEASRVAGGEPASQDGASEAHDAPPDAADLALARPEPEVGAAVPAEAPPPQDAPPPADALGPDGPPPAPAPHSEMTRRWDEVVQRLQEEARGWQVEVEQVRSVVDRAQEQARQALDERDSAYLEGEQARRERDELAQALAMERGRNEELTRVIEQLRSQIADVGRTLDQTLPVSSEGPADGPGY